MKDKRHINCDILIIGAGFAGMAASARASQLGLKTVMAGNSSQLYFASGLFDLLGVYPLVPGTIIKRVETGLSLLKEQIPEHPYSKAGIKEILQSFDFITHFLQTAGLSHAPSNGENTSVLTSAGTFKPSFLVPETIKKCNLLKKSKNLLIMDFKGLKGFNAKQLAAMLKNRHDRVDTLRIKLFQNSHVLSPMHLAAMFENPSFLEKIAKQILPFADRIELMGMPAVCGIDNSAEILAKLEKMTNIKIFEIPMMPPSIPGLRLKNAFEKQLAKNKVKFLSQTKIQSHESNDDGFILNAVNQNMETRIKTKGVILASGRFQGGGLHAQRDKIIETIFNLPVYQPGNRNLWHHINFFEQQGHMINTAGIETDNVFRPVDENSSIVHENLYAAGTILAHNDWTRLKSGSGVSALSAYTAVNDFYKKNIKAGN
ncbi:MAG: anaerobic glycerol-3-phosphate dehydrogenase subunit B [Desulfobacula sp.]|nr:anaerobic glycerol-3-phosphate dehydrogenase subunit B [Desulfobacula sp.]